MSTILVIAAIRNVPIFLFCMFLLQTRFRPEMQSDEHYARYLKEENYSQFLASRIRTKVQQSGLGILDLAQGHAGSLTSVSPRNALTSSVKETA